MVQTDQNTIDLLLKRGVADVIVHDDLEKKLKSGKQLRIKLGIDPTGFDLTLGHAVVLRKLRQFQDAGHHIILLFGTFTGKIGDPTGKSQTRTALTDEQIRENMTDYLNQAGKVLDIEKVEVVNNGDWLSPMNFEDVLKLAGTFTVAQMLERDMYQERIKQGKEINLVEFLYPLMQGYDSVAIKADLELGGTDQTFNLLAGRKIQEHFGQTPQNILTVPILVGLDGHEKMSKSLGNYIALNDAPNDMFGKTMSIPDDVMLNFFELCTNVDLKDAAEKIKESPRDAKVWLGQEIVKLYHGAEAAEAAYQDFLTKFVKKDIPDEMPEFEIGKKEIGILDLIANETQFAASTSEARRLIQQNAVSLDGDKITDPNAIISISGEHVLKVGKRKFGRIK